MIVKVLNARLDEDLLIERTVMRTQGGIHDGFKPILGLNIVIGATGSGKSLFAEALWLGTANILAELLGGGYKDLVEIVVGRSGIRPLSFTYSLKLEPHEVGDSVEIRAVISQGFLERIRVVVNGKELRDYAELREKLAYATAHVAALPDRLKATFFTRGDIVEEILSRGYSPCGPLAALVIPISYYSGERIVQPCYVEQMAAPEELRFESIERKGRAIWFNKHSLGEISMGVLRGWSDALKLVRDEAARSGISLIPMLYIDDAFDGLDGRRLAEALKAFDVSDVSIFATTHRLETLSVVQRAFAITYGTRLANVIEKAGNFRIGFVDLDEVEPRYYSELCEKFVWPDAEMCRKLS